ncbi:uncharacterized protein C8R40DRAFT_1167532 [Lentinula edodes]|uniref:uncharacterized protein n=1 Tax=Lentinula edodes TaxID=5353 RepID=UPI001E8D8D3E|nr:uncharacterized protein C8R40DRAFT_1167532 [Lentinula edodes]KAH7878133.1 hypothetical protein C8R40DRAFT_1167532 [Lentinula edodes]
MLSQSEVARLLDRCVDEESPELAMEEILSAYVAWKLIRGQSCALVLQKLRYLTMYLRVTERQWVLATIREVIMVTATELSFGGGLIGACPVSTPLGKQVWNDFRRKLSTTSHAFNTDPEYGGPITFHGLRSIDEPRNPVRHMDGNIISDTTTNTTSSRTNATGDSLATTFYTEAAATLNSSSLSSSHWPLSRFTRRRREQGVMRDEQITWSERPRWILLWFLTRPHLAGRSNMLQMLAPEYRSLVPAYTSFRGTLPMYVSDRLRSRDT